MMHKLSITFITLASLLLSSALFANTKGGDKVVANVNGTPIYKSALDQAYRQNKLFISHKRVTKQSVLNDLINRELGIQRAQKSKLDTNKIVKSKMLDVLYHAQISKDLEPELKKISVTESDLKTYYKKFPEYRTAHILVRLKHTPNSKDSEAALEQALKIYNTLKKSPDQFASLANKFSQTSAAPNGGDIGFQPAIQLAPQYFKAIKGQSVGYISSPVRTAFGYHIIKLMAVREDKEINQALYKKIVYDARRDIVLAKYFNDLKRGASINITKKYLK